MDVGQDIVQTEALVLERCADTVAAERIAESFRCWAAARDGNFSHSAANGHDGLATSPTSTSAEHAARVFEAAAGPVLGAETAAGLAALLGSLYRRRAELQQRGSPTASRDVAAPMAGGAISVSLRVDPASGSVAVQLRPTATAVPRPPPTTVAAPPLPPTASSALPAGGADAAASLSAVRRGAAAASKEDTSQGTGAGADVRLQNAAVRHGAAAPSAAVTLQGATTMPSAAAAFTVSSLAAGQLHPSGASALQSPGRAAILLHDSAADAVTRTTASHSKAGPGPGLRPGRAQQRPASAEPGRAPAAPDASSRQLSALRCRVRPHRVSCRGMPHAPPP